MNSYLDVIINNLNYVIHVVIIRMKREKVSNEKTVINLLLNYYMMFQELEIIITR